MSASLDTATGRAAALGDLVAGVEQAIADRSPLAIRGGGSRAGLGRPGGSARVLDTSKLSGVVLYEPKELVIGVLAGTPLSTVEQLLASNRQMLAFEPMRHNRLFGSNGESTMGGVVATNAAGPRRVLAGAVRDHLLGITLVNGRAEVVRSGGRVMKNVTGLDLVRVNCGAMGTLGVLAEVVLKVMPAPPVSATLAYHRLDAGTAVALMSRALGAPHEVTGAAHIPADGTANTVTLLRLEGTETSVRARLASLAQHLDAGAAETIEPERSAALWSAVRDVEALSASPSDEIWRLSLSSSKAVALLDTLRSFAPRCLIDWGGALVWIALPAAAAAEGTVREAAVRAGGHATMVRASEDRRLAVPPFHPLPPPLVALTRGIKDSFDPHGLFNSGRMYDGY